MKVLKDILEKIPKKEVFGADNISIDNITADSRKVNDNSLFIAVRGTITDGHRFIPKAIELGATAIICEELPTDLLTEKVTFVKVHDSASALGLAATVFFDNPSEKLRLVGVTGTNGKTTTVTLLHDLFTKMGYKAGLISTVENRIGTKVIPSTHTTPDPISLNQLLADNVTYGCEFVFMEVSSHAVHQKRIAGLKYEGAVFSNITHDHLDYHQTFQDYIEAKKMFFDDLPKQAFALTNVDDKRGMVMLQNTKAQKYTYSLRRMADFKAKIIDNSLSGLHLELDGNEFYARMIGEFNAYNLLAVYATAVLLGADKSEVLTVLSVLKGAEGRFDYIHSLQKDIIGIVDYAHTPDALEKVLLTIEKLRKGGERVITVVGCGGDREKTKRPIMAEVACRLSSKVILTSDNPRTEDPETIIKEMESGVSEDAKHNVLSITNRLQAIKTACQLAQKGDIILVAGKGHEKYQEINGEKFPFDDKAILETHLQ